MGFQRIPHLAKQALFSGFLATTRSQGAFQRRADGQRQNHHEPQHGKAQAGFLTTALRIGRLVFLRVGHRGRRAVGDLDVPSFPQPFRQHLMIEVSTDFSSQIGQQRFGQTTARLTIAAGVRRTRFFSPCHPVCQHATNRVAAGRILASNHLRQEGPQRHHRGENALAKLDPLRLQSSHDPFAVQQLPERQRLGRCQTSAFRLDLTQHRFLGTIRHPWPPLSFG